VKDDKGKYPKKYHVNASEKTAGRTDYLCPGIASSRGVDFHHNRPKSETAIGIVGPAMLSGHWIPVKRFSPIRVPPGLKMSNTVVSIHLST